MKTAYINGIILNGKEDMQPLYDMTLVVNDGIIEGIYPAAEADTSSCEVVDLKGAYLMPGLINLHVHIPGSGKPKKKPTDTKKIVKLVTANALTRKAAEFLYKSYAKTELLSGVTTLRSVGGIDYYDTWLRDKIAAGKVTGPRVLASNMAVSVPGGHMAGSLAYEADSPEDAAMYVDKIAKDKPDLIKLMITGGVLDAVKVGEPGVLRMQPELVKAACDRAHELGLPVAAHVESPEGVRVALENGVDTIEHGAEPDEYIIDLFKKRGAALVSTLSPALPFAVFDRSISGASEMAQKNGQIVFKGCINSAKACLKNGIPVGLGTDTGCPFITHYDMWRELNYFCNYCGVTPAFALYSATLGNARIARIDNVTGSLEAGKSADMIATRDNPLDSPKALRNISMVVFAGKRIDNPKVKKMDNVEAELDKFLDIAPLE